MQDQNINELITRIEKLEIEDGQDVILYIPQDQIKSTVIASLSSTLERVKKTIGKDFKFWILPNTYELKTYDAGTLKEESFVEKR